MFFQALTNSPGNKALLALLLLLTAGLFVFGTMYFRLRGWLLLALGTFQGSAWVFLLWLNPRLDSSRLLDAGWGWILGNGGRILQCMPVVWATALVGWLVEKRFHEGAPLSPRWKPLKINLKGWYRPFYWILAFDLLFGQAFALQFSASSPWIDLSQAILLAILGTAWLAPNLAYLSGFLGIWALVQGLIWAHPMAATWPWALSLLALGYGLVGYGLLALARLSKIRVTGWTLRLASTWSIPLTELAWWVSLTGLVSGLILGINIFGVAINAIFNLPLLGNQDIPRVQVTALTFSILGLFYLVASVVARRRRLGYLSILLLLVGWSLEWLLVWGLREVQWYAIPTGLFLLGIGYFEGKFGGERGHSLSVWADRLGALLLLGSAFWQSQGINGLPYAILMLVEGLMIVFWGSLRRLRRFLYAGVLGVVLDIVGILIDPILSANRWIVFGILGLVLLALGTFLQQRYDRVVKFSKEIRSRLEEWQ